jgi:Reverse transcriptase (RNA-dependent DNA polymerase)/gag-polypeptide of LTR copia-type/Integrase core domain/GAG-pre-integrase domain
MTQLLKYRGLWKLVSGIEAAPPAPVAPANADDNKEQISWEEKNDEAMALITLSLSTSELATVRDAANARGAWLAILAVYEAKDLPGKLFLRRQFSNMRLEDGMSMQQHINNIKNVVDQLKSIGSPVTDDDIAVVLLNSLNGKYDSLVVALESRPPEELTSSSIAARLLQEERRRSNQYHDRNNEGNEPAFISRSSWNSGNPHVNKTSSMQQKKKKNKNHQHQHASSKLKSHNENKPSIPNAFITSVDTKSDPVQNDTLATISDEWFIDSGASYHLCHNRGSFQDFAEILPKNIQLGDKRIIQATGTGNISVKTFVKHQWIPGVFTNVLFVPNIAANLLSVSRMTASGLNISFVGNECIIRNKSGEIIGRATKQSSNLYRLVVQIDLPLVVTPIAATAVTTGITDAKIWHDRLGHIGIESMSTLKNLVTGFNCNLNDSDNLIATCQGCLKGKAHRSAMPDAATHRATVPLELVHSDICGPMNVESIGGSSYFITFIDDYSRYIVIKTMKSKDEALKHFLDYKGWAENSTGYNIKTLRTDGGGEYFSNDFDAVLKQYGISRQKTPPYTPQHNGVAERANRTIVESARSMLHSANLPYTFWGDAVVTASYLRNRSPTRTLIGTTPYECWYGEKPSLAHLRVFGCKAYVHIPKEKRTKLDSKVTECIFIGYSLESKAWRLFDRINRRILISRDVYFLEIQPNRGSVIKGNETVTVPLDGDDIEEKSHSIVEPDRMSLHPSPPNQNDEDNHDVVHDDQNEEKKSSPSDPPRRSGRMHASTRALDSSSLQSNDHSLLHAFIADIQQEPLSFAEAMNRTDSKQWEEAAQSEYDSIQAAGTWTLVPLPPDRKAIGCKWVFKIKRLANGIIDRYKARLVAKGFAQKEGVDYIETFAPVAKFCSIRALLALAAYHDLEIHQMDVKTAFLNGDLDVDIYMRQPEGFVIKGKESLVCKLNKSLYGLKQASRAWYQKIDTVLHSLGFIPSQADHCIYHLYEKGLIMYIALYVDDLLLLSNSLKRLMNLKQELSRLFQMKDLGEAQFVLGIQIQRNRAAHTLSISQHAYVKSVVERFNMMESHAVSTPMDHTVKLSKADCPSTLDQIRDMSNIPYQSAVGAIMYAMLGTRPDIAFAITTLSQFSSNPGPKHWMAIKRLFRYLRGTLNYSLTYGRIGNNMTPSLVGYCDSDWGSNIDDRRSITGYVFLLSGGAVSWQAKKQPTVALSSVEAEYMASTQATKEAIWWRTFLKELKVNTSSAILIFSDSQGSIALGKNPEYHARTKHIDIQHHFVREHVSNGTVVFQFITTDDMAADVLTKPLPREKHQRMIEMIGMYASS